MWRWNQGGFRKKGREKTLPPGVLICAGAIVIVHMQSLTEPGSYIVVANIWPGSICLQQTNHIHLCTSHDNNITSTVKQVKYIVSCTSHPFLPTGEIKATVHHETSTPISLYLHPLQSSPSLFPYVHTCSQLVFVAHTTHQSSLSAWPLSPCWAILGCHSQSERPRSLH